jgi:membrane fusion protein (multidrug efflux system)
MISFLYYVSSVFLLFITGLLAGCGNYPESKPDAQPAKQMVPVVQVAPVVRSTISRKLELTGSVEPYRIARLASPAEGPIANVLVREGDRVKVNQPLLSIGRKQGIDALTASLKEELKKEADNLERTRQLVVSKALPQEQLDYARAAYEKVNAQLIRSEETARDYRVAAPWSGVVSRVIVKEGEFVGPRAALLEMYDPTSLVIRTAVPEKYAAEVSRGMAVNVDLDAFPHDTLTGKVDRVYPYLDSRLRTRIMEITLDRSIPLLPGMFARLKVLLKSEVEALVVPIEAVVERPKGKMIFVVDSGKALARLIQTGIQEGRSIQIVSGVKQGEKIVVAGNEKLKNDVAVRIAGGKPQQSGAGPMEGQKKKAGGNQQ